MVHLALGIQLHLPLTAAPTEAEEYYRRWQRLLAVIKSSPEAKLNLSLTGTALEWLEEHQPDYLDALRQLLAEGRLELLGSGLYSPILTLLPEQDRTGQLAAGSERLHHLFGVRPEGAVLAGKVWEQSLVATLNTAGFRYVLLDERHFRNVGFEEEELFGYYLTEDQGRTLALIPGSARLRRLLSFPDADETLRFLTEQAAYHTPRLATVFEADRSFGPEWLTSLLTGLSRNPGITLITVSEYLNRQPPAGRCYVDNAAEEIWDEWALPPERRRRYYAIKDQLRRDPRSVGFLRAGYFRNLLKEYTEANLLHKRMLFITHKLHRSRKSEERKRPARMELYKAQSADILLGVDGTGIYSPEQRSRAYYHLLTADNLLAENTGLKLTDFDTCGRNEIVFDYKQFFAVIAPHTGGVLLELDDKLRNVNWLATITRRPELYHQHLKLDRQAPGPNPAGFLYYDRCPRYTLLDHFYDLKTTAEDCYRGSASELFPVALLPRDYQLDQLKTIMTAVDFLTEKPSHLYKELVLETSRLSVTYDVLANFWQPYRFAVDFGLLPVVELTVDDQSIPLDAVGETLRARRVTLRHSSGAQLLLTAGKLPFTVWYYPIETIAPPEAGARRIYQGAGIVLSWAQHQPAGVFEFTISWQ